MGIRGSSRAIKSGETASETEVGLSYFLVVHVLLHNVDAGPNAMFTLHPSHVAGVLENRIFVGKRRVTITEFIQATAELEEILVGRGESKDTVDHQVRSSHIGRHHRGGINAAVLVGIRSVSRPKDGSERWHYLIVIWVSTEAAGYAQFGGCIPVHFRIDLLKIEKVRSVDVEVVCEHAVRYA